MSERLDQARNRLPIEKILKRQERFPQIIARRQAEFNRIGVETEIKWGDSPLNDIGLTDRGDKAMAHIEALQTLKQLYDVRADDWKDVLAEAETYGERLGQVNTALERFQVARPGVVPQHVVEMYQIQQQQMMDRPQTDPDFKKALDYLEAQKQKDLSAAPEQGSKVTLTTRETVEPTNPAIEEFVATPFYAALVGLPAGIDQQLGIMLARASGGIGGHRPYALTAEQLIYGMGRKVDEPNLAEVQRSLIRVTAHLGDHGLLVTRQEPQDDQPGGFIVMGKPTQVDQPVTPEDSVQNLETELLAAAAAVEPIKIYKQLTEIIDQNGNLIPPEGRPFRPESFVARFIAVVTNTKPGKFAQFDLSKVVPEDRVKTFQQIFGEPKVHYGRLEGIERIADEVLRQVGLQIGVDRGNYIVIPMEGFIPPATPEPELEYDSQNIKASTFTLPNGDVVKGLKAAGYTKLFGTSTPDYANLDLSKLQNIPSDELAKFLYGTVNSITLKGANSRVIDRENPFAEAGLVVVCNDPGHAARARGVRGSYGVRKLSEGRSEDAAVLLTKERAGMLLFLFTDPRIAKQCNLERLPDDVATKILTSLDPDVRNLSQDQVKGQLRFMIDIARKMSETGQLDNWIDQHPAEVQEMLMNIGLLGDVEVEKLRAALAKPETIINLRPNIGGNAEEGESNHGKKSTPANGETHKRAKDHLAPLKKADEGFDNHVNTVVKEIIAAFGESDRSTLLDTKVLGTQLTYRFRLTETHCDRYKVILGIDPDMIGTNPQYSLVDVCLFVYLHKYGRSFSVQRRAWVELARHFEQVLTRESRKIQLKKYF